MARQLLRERPHPLLLNAGDNFQGTVWFTVYGWNITAQFLNRLPWDAVVLGNHEFDRKVAGAVSFVQALHAPVVVANMVATKEPSMHGLYRSSVVVQRAGRQIGIIGIITSDTNKTGNSERIEFTSEEAAAAAEARHLKSAGVNIIVVLSHSGIDKELDIAHVDPNVDIVVGGHSHSLLYTGTPPSGEISTDVYPIIVTQPSGRKVAVVQAGEHTRYLGNLTAFFDDEGELVSAEGNPVYLNASVEPDVTLRDVLAALPFRNTVDVVEVTGAALRDALERAAAEPDGQSFLHVSGLRVAFDADAPPQRPALVAVSALCHACAVPVYEPLKDDAWYPVALSSYLAAHKKDIYPFSEQGRNHEVGLLDTDVLLEHLQVEEPVVQAHEGRIVFVRSAAEKARLRHSGNGAARANNGNAAPAAPDGKRMIIKNHFKQFYSHIQSVKILNKQKVSVCHFRILKFETYQTHNITKKKASKLKIS
ncbi:Apyrase, partial [Gryllus bimaculatus]